MTTAGAVLGAATFQSTPSAAPMSAVDSANVQTIKAMASTWETDDRDARMRLFTDDCSVRTGAHHVDRPALVGRAWKERASAARPTRKIIMQNHEIFALDPIVVTSHHQLFPDGFVGNASQPQDDWFVGIFFMQDGRIREWLDYAVWEPRPRAPIPKGFGHFHRRQPLSAIDRTNVDFVEAMSTAWGSGDIDQLLPFFSDDCRVRLTGHRVEMPPVVGVKSLRESLMQSGYFTTVRAPMHTLDVLALHPVVIASHHQLFDEKGKTPHDTWFVGTFFFEYGRIREWVEYQLPNPTNGTRSSQIAQFHQAST